MLKYNLAKLFSSKGISYPASFLMKNGFTSRVAYTIVNNKFKNLSLEQIEQFCLMFKCTPNDLLEWLPDKSVNLEEDIPLKKLMGGNIDYNVLKIVRDVPLDKMEEFAKKMDEVRKSL